MKAYLDYAPMDVDGDRISDVTDSMPTQEMPFVLERKTTKSMLIKNRYEVVTDKGNFIIETTNNKFHDFFKENIEHFKDLKVQWADRNTVNFGYVPTRMEPTRKQYDYDKYSVLLGLSGYDKEMGVLTLSKMGHISRNGIEKSVFGKVTKGRHILDLLGTNDKIKDIREVEVRSEQYEYEVVTDDATIKENDNIITKTVIDVFEQCPFAVEHLLFLIRDGVLAIDKKNITYCRNDKLQGVSLPQESSLERKRGSISVRNAGKGKGSVFIYFRDAIEDKSHSVAGNIINGLELPMNLKPGQRFKIESKTERLNTLGLEQIEAEKITKRIGIGHERIGDTDDNAIIIEQDPEITMDAKKNKKIVTKGIDPNMVFKIRLFEDKAPNSTKYFKTITGLTTRQLGSLDVLVAHEDLDMIMFKGDQKMAGELAPENAPSNGSKKGRIGITNMASRQRGIIGVRFNDSEEYGPTGEDMYHTNCVGEVINFEKLRDIKEGDTIYLTFE